MTNQETEVTPKTRRPPRSRRRIWIFRTLAIAFPFLLIGLSEAILRTAGYGTDLSLVIQLTSLDRELPWQINPRADRVYVGIGDVMGPQPRRIDIPPQKEIDRVVVIGGSTVIGFPYAPEVAFPKYLQVLLNDVSPERPVEVLNLGITSINSFAVADLVQQSLQLNPDLIILHTGHNEFYGPGGPASTAQQIPTSFAPSFYRWRRTRLSQLLTLTSKQQVQDDLLSVLPSTFQIPFESEMVSQATDNLISNLDTAITTASNAGIPVVLTTVACNLRDQGPLNAFLPHDITEIEQNDWAIAMRDAEIAMLDDNYELSREKLNKAIEVCPEHAASHYRLAQCLERLNEPDAALKEYELARDYDGCRFRAPSPFTKAIRDIAASHPSVQFVDVVDELDAYTEFPAPGFDLFLEHVHYNQQGHAALARLLAPVVQNARKLTWPTDHEITDDELVTQVGLVTEDELAALSFSIQVLESRPFQNTLDHQQHIQFLVNEILGKLDQLSPSRRECFESLNTDVMTNSLIESLVKEHLRLGNLEDAHEMAQILLKRKPWKAESYQLAAQVAEARSDTQNGNDYADRARELAVH
ncbi:hypothetical protein KOR42_36300 [Thalassoglobus neptunius]|uniref:Uncharacterized protein n=1 Tax=Thalassoglobus neptunius TaxID=1938619 RepID=A0A5C5WH11_9PLAN|nr:tetratricopeptide repeat protein [Thalassoglobus neptunius]TWT50084.1 hypothetical protein KOR42_36300 [Thalassoglobus neptunius]